MLLSEAAIISTMMEALLYGFSLLMFMITLWILLQNRCRRRPNYPMIVSAILLELLATGELALNIVRLWQGLVTDGPYRPLGTESFFAIIAHKSYIAKSVLNGAQTLILDGIVIYRTYAVWKSIYTVILPIMCWLGLLGCSIGTSIALNSAQENRDTIFVGSASDWVMSVYALTLTTNLSASLLLAYRIWKTNRDALRYLSSNRLTPVLRAVIESGALYSASITVILILFVCKSVGVYVMLDMISPIICITFNMLIIRVAFAADKVPSLSGSRQHTNTASDRSGHGHGQNQSNSRHIRAYGSGGFELKSLAVEITRYIETDQEIYSGPEADRKVSNNLGEPDESTESPSTLKTLPHP